MTDFVSTASDIVKSPDTATRFWIAFATFTFVIGGFQASITLNQSSQKQSLRVQSELISDLHSTVELMHNNYIRLESEVKKNQEIANLRHP